MNATNSLVSPCGLFCGECGRYKKGKCPGCAENSKATWCKIRICTKKHGYSTCADCTDFSDVNKCGKFNTIFSKFFYYFFKSDRKASLQFIKDHGLERYVEEMKQQGKMVISRQ